MKGEDEEHISEEDMFINDKDVEDAEKVVSHYHADFESLLNRCLIYKKAHSDCKSFHYMFDKIIKLSILSISSIELLPPSSAFSFSSSCSATVPCGF